MERWYRPRALEKRRNVARQCARCRGGDQRGMIKATVSKPRWIRGDRHECGVPTKLSLNTLDCTSKSSPERISQRGNTVELQGAHDLAQPAFIRTDPCASGTPGWRNALLDTASTSEPQLRATRTAEECPLNSACTTAVRGKKRQRRSGGPMQLGESIAGTLGDLHPRTIVRRTYYPRIGRYDTRMTSTTVWTVRTLPLAELPPSEWERLLATNPTASAFSNRAVHEAWWIGYGAEATDISLAVYDADGALSAYLPLMLRPDGVRYLGATYHIDYATVLIDLTNAERATTATEALVAHIVAEPTALDLRRLRHADRAHEVFMIALKNNQARTATLKAEEPAPAIDLTNITTFDEHLERIDKKDRHEIRRKVRRGEGAGVTISAKLHAVDDLAEFIKLHRSRWGHHGLFTEDEKGARDEAFMRELFVRAPEGLITIIVARNLEFGAFAAGLFLRDATGIRYWNAGGELAARSLSPGILLFAHGLQMAITERKQVFDFLRGNEGYKYEVGATDVDVLMMTVPAA
jgi:CelD/BcsL family acetyltransferase involved in cellulose biosynthesis